MEALTNLSNDSPPLLVDEFLFGWEATPGIVSVWASRSGKALVWQRLGDRISCTCETFRSWLFATTLDDLSHLGAALQPEHDQALVSYRELDGPVGSYRYLLSARDGRNLERALLDGASRRLGRQITSLSSLEDTYYRVGPVEQYLMSTGRVYFRGMAYHDLHRLAFDLETTSLDPARGRIFLVAVRDNRGFERNLEASTPEQEATLIVDLCALIRRLDPDTIENHNLMGFDLPYLEYRASVLKVPLYLGREGAPQHLESSAETRSAGPHRWTRRHFSVAGRELIDTLDAVRRYDFVVRNLPSYRLKDVARHFGLVSPDRVYLEGEGIPRQSVQRVWPEKAQTSDQMPKNMGQRRSAKEVHGDDQPHDYLRRQTAHPSSSRAVGGQDCLDLRRRDHLLKHVERHLLAEVVLLLKLTYSKGHR